MPSADVGLLVQKCKQVTFSLVTNSNNGLSVLGEIKIMSKVDSEQLCIARCAKFGDDQLRGYGVAVGQILVYSCIVVLTTSKVP